MTSLALICILAAGLSQDKPLVSFKTRTATFDIDSHGSLNALTDETKSTTYIPKDQPSPFLQVRIEGKFYAPDHASWHDHRLTLTFDQAETTATVKAIAKPSHVAFELIAIHSPKKVELVLWGPYPTTIKETVGEIVGVVHDSTYAIGIQSLNPKTLGGYPTTENDIEAESNADDQGDYPTLPPELKKDQHFRGDTARYTSFGTSIQAYCRNRDADRIISNWGYDKYLAPAFSDGGVIGSKIALFGCPASKALDTIGDIELAEGLPHPMLDGVWAKKSPVATCSYLIVDFGEDTIDRAIEMTKKAGLTHLYHSSPFETWGHFELKPSLFPHGWDGLRACVEKARLAGIKVGFHTLSNFITPNDPYVTPIPDPRVAKVGATPLKENLTTSEQEIPVTDPDIFQKASPMSTVQIGSELIKYDGVSNGRLLKCQRGAWGTTAAPHPQGAPVAKLMDHDYKVFLTNADLTQEVARTIAKLCNYAGTDQISMDGLEGNWSTGMGQYGRTLFATAWYGALNPKVRDQINDASNPGHFNWHISTRMNWGEPWYAGFRESQTLYRFKNQLFFERNLMPHMLGWFALRPETTVEDAEWLLARAAGYDAGFALASSLASTAQLQAAPSSKDPLPGILEAVKEWETARLGRAFPESVKAQLRDNRREFHLTRVSPKVWDLYPVANGKLGAPIRITANR